MSPETSYINQVMARLPRVASLRSQVAMELRSHIAERVEHGQTVDEALRQLGDPVTLAESYLAAIPLVPATFWQRGAARIIDFLAFACVCAPIVWLLSRTLPFVVPPGFVVPVLIIVVVILIVRRVSLSADRGIRVGRDARQTPPGTPRGPGIRRPHQFRAVRRSTTADVSPGVLDRRDVRALYGKTSARLRAAVEDARRARNGGKIMMKQTLIAPAVVGLLTLLSGQTSSTQRDKPRSTIW